MAATPEFVPTSTLYLYVRGRQLEGTFNADPDIGMWPVTANRVLYGLGTPPEEDWPYIKSAAEWPPADKPELDKVAKERRILFYHRIRTVAECRKALQNLHPVSAAFDITKQWFDAPSGKIQIPDSAAEVVGSHGLCIDGFEDESQQLHFSNSWGAEWGDNGRGTLPYDYFGTQLVSAWVFAGVGKPRQVQACDRVQYLNLGFRSPLGHRVHVMECYDYNSDQRIGWAIGVQRDSTLDIEDVFVRPEFRGKGYGGTLFDMIREFQSQLSVRIWFTHADTLGDVQTHLCKSLSLNIEPTDERWSPYVAQSGSSAAIPIAMPLKPQIWWPTSRTGA